MEGFVISWFLFLYFKTVSNFYFVYKEYVSAAIFNNQWHTDIQVYI